MKHKVVVTGIGLVTPLRPFQGVDAFWNALCAGQDAVKRRPLPLLDIDRQWLMAGIDMPEEVGNVMPEERIQFIAEYAVRMALEDAVLINNTPLTPLYRGEINIGLALGTVLGNVLSKEKRLIGKIPPSPLFQRGVRGDFQKIDDTERESLSYINPHLASRFNLTGPCITVSTACASGTDAIGVASRKIMAGQADVMIAGGVDVLSDFAVIGFHTLQALTEDRVRPFDKNRTGLALGEGAAFLLLESEQRALARGVKIYGRILGYASRADANHLTGPHKEGRGLADAMTQAMAEADVTPQEIGYINAHGTGTPYNDLMETKAFKKVLGKSAYNTSVSSTKSMLGHAFAASGAIEAACCLLAVKNKTIPPTINYQEADPECDLDYTPNISRHRNVSTAMSVSAGFGGQNAAIVVGKA